MSFFDFREIVLSISVGVPWNTNISVVPGRCTFIFCKRQFGGNNDDIVSATIEFNIDKKVTVGTTTWHVNIASTMSSSIATASVTQNYGNTCKIRYVYVDGDIIDFVITDGNVSVETITNTLNECLFWSYQIGWTE